VDSLGKELAQALGELLQRSNRARLYDGMLADAPVGVDEHNYPVLSGLARFGPSTAARLAAEIGLDRSRVSRHADRLEQIGWLRREPNPADARGTLLILTPRGHDVIAALRDSLANHLGSLVADWPAGLAESVVDGLRRLTDADSAGPDSAGRSAGGGHQVLPG
jgi:DNA-binding MarR family transcriptional regulator